MKVAVVGEIYSANLGDNAIYECIRYLLQERGISCLPVDISGREGFEAIAGKAAGSEKVSLLRKVFRVLIRGNLHIRRLFNFALWIIKERRSLEIRWRRHFSSVDVILVGGGQLITDLDFGFPPKLLLIKSLARQLGKPIAVFGCGVGEWGFFAKIFYRKFFRGLKFVSVRDDFSREYLMAQSVFDGEILVHPDPAFVISDLFPGCSDLKKCCAMGVNVHSAAAFRRFVPELQGITDDEFISFWINSISKFSQKFDVYLFANGDTNDFEVAQKVHEGLLGRGVRVDLLPRPRELSELVSQISRFEVVVCTRMHAGIIAYSLGSVVRAVSWDRKVDDVWLCAGENGVVISPAVIKAGSMSIDEFEFSRGCRLDVHRTQLRFAADKFLSSVFRLP